MGHIGGSVKLLGPGSADVCCLLAAEACEEPCRCVMKWIFPQNRAYCTWQLMVLKVGPWLIPDIYLIYSYPPFLFLPVEKKKTHSLHDRCLKAMVAFMRSPRFLHQSLICVSGQNNEVTPYFAVLHSGSFDLNQTPI